MGSAGAARSGMRLVIQPRLWPVIRILAGLLCLAAAALKSHGMALGPLSRDSVLSSPPLQVAAIEIEILLGVWLLSGQYRGTAWLAAMIWFMVLGGASLYLALVGQRSCGCLGVVHVSPWTMFIADITTIGVLAACRPRCGLIDWGELSLRRPLTTAVSAGAMFVLACGVFLVFTHASSDVLARARGESITLEPSVYDAGDGVAGEGRTVPVEIVNHTRHPIRVVGGTRKCSCRVTEGLPLTVSPHGSASLEVYVRFSGTAGVFRRAYVLYTDDEQHPFVTAQVTGRVVNQSPSPQEE
jgi:hypothetical protein